MRSAEALWRLRNKCCPGISLKHSIPQMSDLTYLLSCIYIVSLSFEHWICNVWAWLISPDFSQPPRIHLDEFRLWLHVFSPRTWMPRMPRGCWWALTRSGHPSSRKKGNTKRTDSLDPTTDPEGIGMNNRPNMATNLDNAFGSLGVPSSLNVLQVHRKMWKMWIWDHMRMELSSFQGKYDWHRMQIKPDWIQNWVNNKKHQFD